MLQLLQVEHVLALLHCPAAPLEFWAARRLAAPPVGDAARAASPLVGACLRLGDAERVALHNEWERVKVGRALSQHVWRGDRGMVGSHGSGSGLGSKCGHAGGRDWAATGRVRWTDARRGRCMTCSMQARMQASYLPCKQARYKAHAHAHTPCSCWWSEWRTRVVWRGARALLGSLLLGSSRLLRCGRMTAHGMRSAGAPCW